MYNQWCTFKVLKLLRNNLVFQQFPCRCRLFFFHYFCFMTTLIRERANYLCRVTRLISRPERWKNTKKKKNKAEEVEKKTQSCCGTSGRLCMMENRMRRRMVISILLFYIEGEKPHVCMVCNKGFSTSSSLNTHKRIHSGEKPHQCLVCGKKFTASSNLYYHRMTHIKVSTIQGFIHSQVPLIK